MTYQESVDRYNDPTLRARIDMCAREQGLIYAEDPDPETAALGRGVIGGQPNDLEALAAAVISSPNGAALDNDPDLLAAMQSVWATVAAARYPAP